MSSERRGRPIRHILVAIDASPHSLAALQAAVELAAALQAELSGVFVEDVNLLRLAGLPFTREYGLFTGTAHEVDTEHVEQQLRARAGQARRAMTALAEHSQVRWSFRVRRGPVPSELLAAASEADLMVVGRAGWSLPTARRLGSTARAVLAQAPGLALVLEHGLRLGLPVLAVFDGSPPSEEALVVAAGLVRLRGGRLTVLILADQPEAAEELRERAAGLLAEGGVEARFRLLAGVETVRLARVIGSEGCGLLVMAGDSPLLEGDGVLRYLSEAACPVLLVPALR